MKAHFARLLALCLVPFFGACADQGAGPSGPGVEITVAPLTLPGVLDVEYALAVFNANPASYANIFTAAGGVLPANNGILVWQQPMVTSGTFGNGAGGDISYVGPCDASPTSPHVNYVALALKQVYVGTGGSETGISPFSGSLSVLDDENTAVDLILPSDTDPDFVNPCDYRDPCVLSFPCSENQDTSVVFNLTIMRDANQGFFDIAVNFEDIFCSAKFETCYDDTDNPLSLELQGETYYAYEDSAGEKFWAHWEHTASTPYWRSYRQDAGGGLGAEYVSFYSSPGPTPPATLSNGVQNLTALTGTPIELLFGPNPDDVRQHTGIAALACTIGADTVGANGNVTTELLMTTPTVSCNGGAVTFSIPLAGAAAGNAASPGLAENAGTHCAANTACRLNYALYFGNEDLDCGNGTTPGSCNKVYYNIAINIANLASQGLTNCSLSYAATAIEAGDISTFDAGGDLIDPAAQYGAINFGSAMSGLPLTTTAGQTSCNSHPLGADGSLVQAGYIKGSGYGGSAFGFDVYTLGNPAVAFAADTIPPTVLPATIPPGLATGVPVSTSIKAVFSESMSATTITSAAFTVAGAAVGGAVGNVTYDPPTHIATFTPTAALAANTVYTVTITPAVMDEALNPMAAAYVWTFTTGAAAVVVPPPTLVVPPPTLVKEAAAIRATFSKVMDLTTINLATFTLHDVTGGAPGTPVPGAITYGGVAVTEAFFWPTGGFVADVSYKATITGGASGVKDLVGNYMGTDWVVTFPTQAVPVDTTPPAVTLTNPAASATGIVLNTAIIATFNEALNPATIANTLWLNETLVAAIASYDEGRRAVTWTLTAPLAADTAYVARILGVKDIANNSADYTWSFTTGAVKDANPPNGGTAVALNAAITATFVGELEAATINATTFIVTSAAETVTGIWSQSYADGTTTATLVPTSLKAGASYTARIEGARYLGGATVTASTWNFTTAAVAAPPAPTQLRVFVTKLAYRGDFGGLAGADANCLAAANAANLGGQWMAWLSLGNMSPSNRFSAATRASSQPFVLVDGSKSKIADNWGDLIDGTLAHRINISEDGTEYWAANGVWTETHANGTSANSGDVCLGFTSTGGTNPYPGSTAYLDANWSYFGGWSAGCSTSLPFYCVEQAP